MAEYSPAPPRPWRSPRATRTIRWLATTPITDDDEPPPTGLDHACDPVALRSESTHRGAPITNNRWSVATAAYPTRPDHAGDAPAAAVRPSDAAAPGRTDAPTQPEADRTGRAAGVLLAGARGDGPEWNAQPAQAATTASQQTINNRRTRTTLPAERHNTITIVQQLSCLGTRVPLRARSRRCQGTLVKCLFTPFQPASQDEGGPDGDGRTNAFEMAKRTRVSSLPSRLAIRVDDPRSSGFTKTASSRPSFALMREETLMTAEFVMELVAPCEQSFVSRSHVPLDRASATMGPGADFVASTNQGPLPATLLARPIHVPQISFRGPSAVAPAEGWFRALTPEEQAVSALQPSMTITQPRPVFIPRVSHKFDL